MPARHELQTQEILNRAFNSTLNALRLDVEGALRQDQWREYAVGGWTAVVAGSGATAQAPHLEQVATGATGSSTALLKTSANAGLSAGRARTVIDFDKRLVMVLYLTVDAATTNGLLRVTLGKPNSGAGSGVGNLTIKGIGIRIANVTIAGHHYGTSAVTTTLSPNALTATTEYRVVVVSAAGAMEWFLDDGGGDLVSLGTATTGPTGLGTAGNCLLQVEADNGVDAVDTTFSVHSCKLYVAQ